MDPTNISKIKSYQMIMQKKNFFWNKTYVGCLPSSDVDKRGWDSAHPAFSCKEILDSGHSKGDGEYWINPEKSGNPLRVYCDRSRYGGK